MGLACFCIAVYIGYHNTSAGAFWSQLVLLGIGWNFLFIAGTTLLPSTHTENQRFKAQSVNDFTVFSFQAVAALSAGWALNLIGWQSMVLLCCIPILMMLGILLWERLKTYY